MSKQPLIDLLDQAIGGMMAKPNAASLPADPEVAELLRLARELRGLPRADFKANLKAELERKAIMMIGTKAAGLRSGFHTITPYLHPKSVEFLDLLKHVFGAEETLRTEVGPGMFHAEVRVGDSMLMLGVGSGYRMPAMMEVYVPNVDEVCRRAVDAGCVQLEPVENAHWEPIRLGCVGDPAGNVWAIVTRLGENYLPEGRHSVSAGFAVEGAPRFAEFLTQAYGAQQLQRWEWPGGFYASFRIGDSVVGVNEASGHEWLKPMKTMINMYVPDCDTVYRHALDAGAQSILPVAVQPYGVRSGAVEDAWGNQWFIATPL
jgi:PhnB protein